MVSIGICDCSMNLSTFPPVSDESVSRPRMMPDTTSMPKPFNVSMEPSSGTIMLCSLEIDLSASGSGVSMPQKIVVKAAGKELVELGSNLLGGLVSRDAAVQRGDVAEFALIRTAA